jgi:hypothetical protein
MLSPFPAMPKLIKQILFTSEAQRTERKHSAAEPQPKLRMVLEGVVKKVSFTADQQSEQRERRG